MDHLLFCCGHETCLRVMQALRIMADEKIGVDGRLDEAAWARAVPITDFKQFEPRNGEPGTERAPQRRSSTRTGFSR